MNDEYPAFQEFAAAENGLEEAEAMMWAFLQKVLDQRVRMTKAWANNFTREALDKSVRELHEAAMTGTSKPPPLSQGSHNVLECARVVWETRLDEQVDSWRDARIRYHRAYKRWMGDTYEDHIEAVASKAAPLVGEILENDSSPAVAAWASLTLKRMARRATNITPGDQVQ